MFDILLLLCYTPLFLLFPDPNLQTAVLSCLRMVVCVHTPLQEVVEIMRPTTAEISAGNRGTSQPNSSTSDSTNGNSSAEMNVDLQVPPESSWLIHWCVHAINRRENSLVVRLEALQFLGSFVKSYVFLVRYACCLNVLDLSSIFLITFSHCHYGNRGFRPEQNSLMKRFA